MKKQQINMVPVEKLIPYVNNARRHSEQQVSQIAASIKEFGFVNPILVDAENVLIAGHGRLAAAHKLGLKEVPCLRVEHLTEAQKRAYILADNRLAELAEWDKELLNLELTQLKDLDFNFELTGFDQDFVDEIQPIKEGLTDEDAVPEVDEEKTPISKRGMTWLLGKHRLRCGDSTDESDVAALMNGEKADMVFTDPPYGMNLDTDYESMVTPDRMKNIVPTKSGKKHRPVLNDDKPFDAGYIVSLADEVLLFGADYYCHSIPASTGSWFVWNKRNGEESQKAFGSCFELAWSKVKHKREMANIHWQGVFGVKDDTKGMRLHPTQKPIQLVEWFFERIAGQSVLDLFGGSGSTLIACEKTNRRCFMMELDEKYCDVIVKRWQEFTGQKATLEGTDKTFDDLAAEQ